MKNLKKVLALGLALVMLLGMFTVASAAETKMVASDLKDFETVADAHKDAVSLAVDLGIINGIADEEGNLSFKPQDPINRASWAKMVFYAATGRDDAASEVGSASSIIKDIDNHWANGYISYLAVEGYVSGDQNGNYTPDSDVTVAAAYKMMLTILGWDANDRAYVGETWSANVVRDARNQGLNASVDSEMKPDVALTRENAAQIIFNALQAKVVEPEMARGGDGVMYVNKYNNTDTTLGGQTFGLIKVVAKVTGLDKDGKAVLDVANATGNGLAITNHAILDSKIAADSSVVGQVATFFARGEVKRNDKGEAVSVKLNAQDPVVSTSLIAGTAETLKVLTNGADLNKVIDPKDKDKNYVAALDAKYSDDENNFIEIVLDVYVDGEKVEGQVAESANKVTNWGDNVAELAAKAGNKVELIDNDDNGAIDTIKITTYTVKKATADVENQTKNDKAQVRLKGVIPTWTDADKVVGIEGLAKDDVVLVSVNKVNNVTTLEKAEVVTGTVESSSDGVLTVVASDAKVELKASGIADAGLAAWSNYDDTFKFFKDINGTVCAVEQVTEAASSAGIAYVLTTGWTAASNSQEIGATNTKALGQAQLLYTDGKVETLKDVIKANDVDLQTSANGKGTLDALQGQFVKVSTTSKGTELASQEAVSLSKDTKISGKIDFDANANTAGANASTIFLVGKGDPNSDKGWDYSHRFVGYAGVPGMTTNADGAMIVENGVAKYVVLFAAQFEGDIPDGYIYVQNAAKPAVSKAGKTYAIVNAQGETKDGDKAVTITTLDEVAVEENGFYKIAGTNESGVVTKLTKAADTDNKLSKITNCGDSVFSTEDGKTVSYDGTTVCVLVDVKADGSFVEAAVTSLDEFDLSQVGANTEEDTFDYASAQAIVVGENNGLASYIYILRTAQAAEE